MGKRKRVGRREREALKAAAHVKGLVAELASEPSNERAAAVRSELAKIRLAEENRKQPKRKPSQVPVPQSYVDAVAAKRDEAHRVSGFSKITATFVQGGSPGAGRRS